MSSPFQPLTEAEHAQLAKRLRTKHRRVWWIIGIAVATPLALIAITVLSGIVWLRMRHQTATRDVQAEVARIQAAGEPITTSDMYAYHVVPADVPDITPLWIAALDSFDDKQLSADGAQVPVVGQAEYGGREVDHDEMTVAATEAFLRKYDPTIELALAASKARGQCRFPVKFEDGIGVQLPYPQKMRQLARLMLLRIRVSVAHDDTAKALESLEAIFAAARSQAHQLTLVEQLVAMAIAGVGHSEAEKLLNDVELNDEELTRLSATVSSVKPEDGLTYGMIGERGMGYHSLLHAGPMAEKLDPATPFPGEGQLSRPVDCRYYLGIMEETIEAARKPYPEALRIAERVDTRMSADMKKRLSRFDYVVTFLLAPALSAAFEAAAKNVARRDATLCALAAERYRLAQGKLPEMAADLAPEFLAAVPTDPFDGQPLRMKTSGEELVFYSVGKDRKDDGGAEQDRRMEPDIVVSLQQRSK